MPLDFPSAPAINDTFIGLGGIVYVWDGTKWVASTSGLSGGPYAPLSALGVGRNLVHNPMFNVAQRGAGPFTASAILTADRWWQWVGTGDTISTVINASSDAIRAAVGDEACAFDLYSTFTGGAGASNLVLLQQNIEGVRRLGGKTVTLSFWAAASAGTPKVGVNLEQSFGTGGSPSAVVTPAGQAVTVATTWARYSLAFAMPSTAGKTLGTNNNDSTQCNLWLSAGSSYASRAGGIGAQSGSIAFWGVQLEVGSVATPLEHIDPGLDLRNCQRFYATTFVQIDTYQLAGSAVSATAFFPATMRATPTIALLGGGSLTNLASVSAWIIGPSSGSLRGAATATGGTGFAQYISASADL